jgi:hypothetical protein
MKMISELSGKDIRPISATYDEALTNAITDTNDILKVINVIQAAWSCNTAHVHGISRILRPLGENDDLAVSYRKSVMSFVEDRMAYWSNFYKSVVVDCRDHIRALKDEARRRNILKQVGRKLSLEDTMKLGTAAIRELSNDKVLEGISSSKTKMVKSNFSSEAYKRATVTVSSDFRVKVFLHAATVKGMILNQADNYSRKRSGWGKKLAAACDTWSKNRQSFMNLSRVTDMLDKIDNIFLPDVTWRALYNDTIEKFTITEDTVTKMLKRNLERVPVVSVEETKEEEDLVSESDRKFLQNNSYAILYDSNTDDDMLVNEANIVLDKSVANEVDDLGIVMTTASDDKGSATNANASNAASVKVTTDMSINVGTVDSETLNVSAMKESVAAKAIRAKIETGSAPKVNFSSMLSKMKTNLGSITAKVDMFDELGYSLRDHLKLNHMQQYHFMAFKKFLESIGVAQDDYKGTAEDIERRAEEYLAFNFENNRSNDC